MSGLSRTKVNADYGNSLIPTVCSTQEPSSARPIKGSRTLIRLSKELNSKPITIVDGAVVSGGLSKLSKTSIITQSCDEPATPLSSGYIH